MTDAVTGKTLLSLGYTQGPWFPAAIAAAEAARAGGANEAGIRAAKHDAPWRKKREGKRLARERQAHAGG